MANVSLLKATAQAYFENLITAERNRAVAEENSLRALIGMKAPMDHTHPASQISDSTAVGRSVLTAPNVAAARDALQLRALATMATSGTPAAGNFLRGDGAWQTPIAPRARQIFTASGIWTKPGGYHADTMVFVQAWAGGAGGARAGLSYSGGGGGGYIHHWFRFGDLPATVPVGIGAGGSVASDGGNTTFGTFLSAAGGKFASRLGGQSAPVPSDFDGGNGGGSGANGAGSLYGGGGGAGAPAGGSRAGGVSLFGGNGGSNAANNGVAPGGGGAEAGIGARGELRIWL